MAIVTHTVSINPAFLQEIKDDHHELRQLMHHTAAMLDRPEWMKVEHARLSELFVKLRDQMAMHFSLEEAYGYFEDCAEHRAASSAWRRGAPLAAFRLVFRAVPPGGAPPSNCVITKRLPACCPDWPTRTTRFPIASITMSRKRAS